MAELFDGKKTTIKQLGYLLLATKIILFAL